MTHYIRIAIAFVLLLLLQPSAWGFPGFDPPPTELHWHDAESIAAYAHKPIDEIGKPPERPEMVSRKAELPTVEQITPVVSEPDWAFALEGDGVAIAHRVTAKVLSIRPWHYHEIDETGAVVRLDVRGAGGAWPKRFFVGVQEPIGWEVTKVISTIHQSRNAVDATMRFDDGKRDYRGESFHSSLFDDDEVTHLYGEMWLVMRRTK